MWILEVALQHHLFMGSMASTTVQNKNEKLEKRSVLPFRYQFAAGAVAGISEVNLLSVRYVMRVADAV
jgi:hypothetical protein